MKIALILTLILVLMFGVTRAVHYEASQHCWLRYEDGSAYNVCTGEQINVPW